MQYLLTLPPKMAEEFASLERRHPPQWFACSDPAGQALGSGGGTANLLFQAWRNTAPGTPFNTWLHESCKLIVHAGGQSRRLPAYAPMGKALMPIPVFRWARGQRLDQPLLDLQLPDYQRVLAHAGPGTAALVTSGDVLLRFSRDLPAFPEVDVLGQGMWAPPELAQDFGVFFCPRDRPTALAFFLQKPKSVRIRELAEHYLGLLDTGMWLLSARAVEVLLDRCGWDNQLQGFTGGSPRHYELYSQFGLALGSSPTVSDAAVGTLTSAVVPLPEARFFHFGTTKQMIESVSALQNLELDGSKLPPNGGRGRPDQITQNARFDVALRRQDNHNLWVENSVVPEGWRLASDHVLTGVPENDWQLSLDSGVCLDFAPIGQDDLCIRPYGFTDTFAGHLADSSTLWFGRPATDWFAARGLELDACGLDPLGDIHSAPLFPVLAVSKIDPEFVQWLVARSPRRQASFEQAWQALPRLSAFQVAAQVNLTRLFEQRNCGRQSCLLPLMKNFRRSVFFRLDLESTAQSFAATQRALPELRFGDHDEGMQLVHDQMFRSAVLRYRGDSDWPQFEARAFTQLQEMIAREAQLAAATPRRTILEDQIVWARSPVRFDLAGGWTDTPPYCIEHGGAVLNLAADLNGQPPIQVFAKLSERPELVLRSIDLGVEERIRSYSALDTFNRPESPFALAKAALGACRFSSPFSQHGRVCFARTTAPGFWGRPRSVLALGCSQGIGIRNEQHPGGHCASRFGGCLRA